MSIPPPPPRRTLQIAALLVACLVCVAPAIAQKSAPDAELTRLLRQIQNTESLLGNADAYERPLLEYRLNELRLQRYTEAIKFAKQNVNGDEQEKQQAMHWLSGQNQALRLNIATLNTQYHALLEQQAAADEAGKRALRQEARLVWGRYLQRLRTLIESIQARLQLGRESRAAHTFVEQHLRRQAALVIGRIMLALEQQTQLAAAPKPLGETAKAQHLALEHTFAAQLAEAASQLSQVAELFALFGLENEANEYRTFAISADGQLGQSLGQGSVSSVYVGLKHYLTKWLVSDAPRWIINTIVVVIILLVFWALARGVSEILSRWLAGMQLRMSSLARDFLVGLAVKLVILAGVLVAAAQMGLEIGPFLAGLGIVGFVVGFALQDSLSNFASGLMILICRPFDEGDYIEAAGVTGTVDRMNLMQTTVFTVENHCLTIPNNVIWGGIIRNISSQEVRRVDLVFGVGYDDDVEQVERVLMEVIKAHPKVVAEPEPVVKLNALGTSAVEFVARPWVKSADYLEVFWDVQKQVKLRFDEEGITIPYPHRTLNIQPETPPAKPAKPAEPAKAQPSKTTRQRSRSRNETSKPKSGAGQ